MAEAKHVRDWSGLQQPILEAIFAHLADDSSRAIQAYDCVCKPWSAAWRALPLTREFRPKEPKDAGGVRAALGWLKTHAGRLRHIDTDVLLVLGALPGVPQLLSLKTKALRDCIMLRHLTDLRTLDLNDSLVQDVAGLKDLPALQTLYLGNTRVRYEDIMALSSLASLQCLLLSFCDELEAVVVPPNVRTLILDAAAFSSCSALAPLAHLETLSLQGSNTGDLASLAGLSTLIDLDLNGTPVDDIGPLSSLVQLQKLQLQALQELSSLAPLAALTNLQELAVSYAAVNNIDALAHLTKLEDLTVGHMHVDDMSPLATLTHLTRLYVEDMAISSFPFLSRLTHLQILSLEGTGLADTAQLTHLTCLQRLDLSRTPVADIAPLCTMTLLQHLDLMTTQIADCTPLFSLTNLRFLCINAECVPGATPTYFSALTALTDLRLFQNSDPTVFYLQED